MDIKVDKPRVLLFSLRNIYGRAHFRCPHFEFEDIICEIDSVDLLAPKIDPSSLRADFATRLAFHAPIALNPGIPRVSVKKHYDLLFTVCGHPQDLIMFNAIKNVKDSCAISVCLLDEFWVKEIPHRRHFLPMLAQFDVVMLYYSQTVKPLSEAIGRRCAFLPPGVDAISFCPYPNPPKRVLDVLSVGRRSEITHQKLLSLVNEEGLFYLHDSLAGIQTLNSREHRALLANCAKRSRYYIVNPGLIDRPDKRGDQIEVGNRYFEGAASGTIMVGEPPNNEAFKAMFDWPDAVTPVTRLPFNSHDIDIVMKDLDRNPERQEKIRRTGVLEALKRHDWVYRWEKILETIGLQPTQEMQQRKDRLGELAKIVSLLG
jgi:hypothetical protein